MKTDSSRGPNEPPPKPRPINEFVRYSGLAGQMAALLLLGYWLGSRVDRALEIDFPAFRIALILLALALSFYSLIKNLPRS